MADAVHFLTNNDNNASGGTWSGCNGLPFPFGTATTGAGTDNPVKVTFDDACKWFYRVKNWTVTTSGCSLTLGSTTVSLGSGTMTAGANFPTRELEILQAGPAGKVLGWGRDDVDGGGDNATSSLAYAGPVGFSPWVNDDPSTPGTDVWPGFPTSTEGIISILPIGTADLTFAWNPSHLPTSPLGNFSVTIDGYSATLYYCLTGSSALSATVAIGSLSFDPSEYWPYAAADGSAIWDVTTGGQLQDPRN